MRLRSRTGQDEAFDGLTAEEIRRIRGAADACRIPGTEGLAMIPKDAHSIRDAETVTVAAPKRKRGRRA